MLTVNSGTSWQKVKVVDGNKQLYDVAFVNSIRGIATSTNGVIYRSLDGGLTWSSTSTQTGDNSYLGIAFVEDVGRHAWIVGTAETIAYSS
ncbi:YCF48-related protein, partial [bacterium]|nr:YCF48-related protein [bacterium]